jgi:hypothetical protein
MARVINLNSYEFKKRANKTNFIVTYIWKNGKTHTKNGHTSNKQA